MLQSNERKSIENKNICRVCRAIGMVAAAVLWLVADQTVVAAACPGPMGQPVSMVACPDSVEAALRQHMDVIAEILHFANDAIPEDGSPPTTGQHERIAPIADLYIPIQLIIALIMPTAAEPPMAMMDLELLSGYEPTTLLEYGEMTLELAEEALAEAILGDETGVWDPNYVLKRVNTIDHLIYRQDPHNYLTMAGIE